MSDFFHLFSTPEASGHLLFAMAAVALAYALFTLAGFGSGLVASSPLALVMPVAQVIPMLALLDFTSSSARGWRARADISRNEFIRLAAGMLLGQLLGVALLARLPTDWMAILLGLFVSIQGCRGLLGKNRLLPSLAFPAIACGVFGGILGGLFGSGGFVYATYLEGRLESRTAFRATQAALIALSTGWRILLCTSLGLIDGKLLLTTLIFVPAMLVGIRIGHRIDLKMNREQLFKLINGLLIASGLSLIVHFLR